MIKKLAGLLLTLTINITTTHAAEYIDGEKAFEEKNYDKAVSIWQPLAQQNDISSQIALAKLYTLGLGVDKNLSTALKFYSQAAEQGSAEAQYQLGKIYADARGVKADHVKARKWYLKAANQGYKLAFYQLGVGYFKGQGTSTDYVKAHAWIHVAVVLGYKEGETYRNQIAGVLSKEKLRQSKKISKDLLDKLNKQK